MREKLQIIFILQLLKVKFNQELVHFYSSEIKLMRLDRLKSTNRL